MSTPRPPAPRSGALALGWLASAWLAGCSAGGVLTDRLGAIGQSSSPVGVSQPGNANGNETPMPTLGPNPNVSTTSPGGNGNGMAANGNGGATNANTQALDNNGFFMGVHVNWDADTGGVAGFVKAVGFVPSLCAGYVTASSDGSFELTKARAYADDVAKNGGKAISYAVTAQVTSLSAQALSDLGAAVTYARGKNLAVFVRYGSEMNGDWSPAYHGGDPAPFLRQWAQAQGVVHAAGGAMVWAPNLSGSGDYNRWMPDPATIDQVGLDAYHQKGDITAGEVDGFIGSIYPLAQRLQKPFVLTETSVVVVGDSTYRIDATEVAQKQAWLNQLVDPTLRAKYPLYRGFVWFDYEKTESASGTSTNDIEWRNFSISVDSLAAAMVRAWYPTVFGASTAASSASTATGAGSNNGDGTVVPATSSATMTPTTATHP